MCPTRQYIIDRSHKIQPMQRHTPCRAIRASRGEVGLESSGGYVLNTTPLLGSKFETCMPWSREQQQRPADKVASLLNDCYYCLGRWISPPPPGAVSKRDCSTSKRVPIPNETFSESSQARCFWFAELFGTDTRIPNAEISTNENRFRGGCDTRRRIRYEPW